MQHLRNLGAIALLVTCAATPAPAATSAPAPTQDDFEVLFSGSGHIQSFLYLKRGSNNLIDTSIAVEGEFIRYKASYLTFRYENETDMGVGEQPGMPFDPNRGRWTFSVASRTELSEHFFEILLRHDCYHGIDRYWPGEDYKMTSAGIAIGSRDYLQKYRYRDFAESAGSVLFPLRMSYVFSPTVYVPGGDFWQRGPYRARLEINGRLDLVRWRRLGLGVELVNVFYLARPSSVQSSHLANLDLFLYGNGHALLLFMGWWPHDDQVLRNRAHKVVAGLELSF